MGPPIYIGGNSNGRPPSNGFPRRFNGATDLHRWKLDSHFGKDTLPKGFNGATDLHRWKQAFFVSSFTGENRLQWGHRFTSVETDLVISPSPGVGRASMGPPIYIGGNLLKETFGEVGLKASMGPPIYIGGNMVSKLYRIHSRGLQWGHRFTSVETGIKKPKK